MPAVAEGRAGVQDEGSQLVALALAAAAVEGRDERWLDLCAGPGGKAALLAALAAERGARLLANERQPHRADLVAPGRCAGADGVLGVVAWPTAPRRRGGRARFDRVLVDAPCTGLGALRRRPEARWRRQPEDLRDLVPLQRALLAPRSTWSAPAAWCSTPPARRCSPRPRDVVGSLLAKRDDVTLAARAPLTAAGCAPTYPTAPGRSPGTVQLWPHRHGTDAMFLALPPPRLTAPSATGLSR